MSSDPERQQRLEAMRSRLLQAAQNALEEECLDSIVIIATYREGGETSRLSAYQGNWYATLGATREFLRGSFEGSDE
jgi:hypothetical protein